MPPQQHPLVKHIPPQVTSDQTLSPSRKLVLGVLPPVTLALSILLLGLLIRSWQLSVGLVGMLFIHEMGHFLAFKLKGIRASLPIFIPFIGAFIMPIEEVASARDLAEIALAGPLAGGVAALISLVAAQQAAISGCGVSLVNGPISSQDFFCLISQGNGALFWLQLAGFGFVINLINLIPINPLDGGRVAGAISRWIWPVAIISSVALLAFDYAQTNHISLFLLSLGIAAIIGFGETIWGFKHMTKSRYFATPPSVRVAITVVYLALIVALAFGLICSTQQLNLWRFIW
jgi:Zn-dependent protease